MGNEYGRKEEWRYEGRGMRGLFFCEGEEGRREEMKKLLCLLSFTGHVLVLTQQKKILSDIIQVLGAMTTCAQNLASLL